MSINEMTKDRNGNVCIILHVAACQHVMTSRLIQLQKYRVELDVALPAPLHTLAQWLQRMEAVLTEEQGNDHASAARNARDKQQQLKVYKAYQEN